MRYFNDPTTAAVFPEFIAREKPGQRGTGCQGRSAGLVRPTAEGEDTARRALTDRHRRLRSREKAMHLGKDDQRSMGQGIRRTQRRAASATACCKHAWLEVYKARSAKTAPCAGRSDATCSAVLGVPSLRGGVRWASADPWRQAQRAAFPRRQGHSKKGGKAPSGYNSPRSAKLRMSPPATIR